MGPTLGRCIIGACGFLILCHGTTGWGDRLTVAPTTRYSLQRIQTE